MTKEIIIPIGGVKLFATITVPVQAKSWIIFAHGSGSSRKSGRNVWVASKLNQEGHATLLFDLLTPDEDLTYENRFSIPLLAERLLLMAKWLVKSPLFKMELPIGLYGASTGAAAALMVVADPESLSLPIMAVVSRGGRPDLAGVESLRQVEVPTLLIVGSLDYQVIELNEIAHSHLPHSQIKLVEGATHLFEEAGTLDEVVKLTNDWFNTYLVKPDALEASL